MFTTLTFYFQAKRVITVLVYNYYKGCLMRRFKWRLFKRKGKRKLQGKDERALVKNVESLKEDALKKGDIKQIAKEVLVDEE
ncbi:hypothetical protein DRP05_10810 [Archaeoglobales archaeon]|nr:MAG: hypothetical protein DRP05_10810 [Archaeoglobales archaeon]